MHFTSGIHTNQHLQCLEIWQNEYGYGVTPDPFSQKEKSGLHGSRDYMHDPAIGIRCMQFILLVTYNYSEFLKCAIITDNSLMIRESIRRMYNI